jgi:nitrogen regulatory protein P-II 1
VKKVEAIVRTERLPFIREALDAAGYNGMTVIEGRGRGVEQPMTMVWRGSKILVDLRPKTKLEIVVPDDLVQPLIEAVLASAYTGEPGDGKIIISPVDEVIRIRTGEYGIKAVSVGVPRRETPAQLEVPEEIPDAAPEPERQPVASGR